MEKLKGSVVSQGVWSPTSGSSNSNSSGEGFAKGPPHAMESDASAGCSTSSSRCPFGTDGPVKDATLEQFKESVLAALNGACKQWGGPCQYLRAMYDTDEKRAVFAQKLFEDFPPKENIEYMMQTPLPDIAEEDIGKTTPMVLHLASFSFHQDASTKVPPGLAVANQLAQENMMDGFITSGQVIKVAEPEGLDGSVPRPWAAQGGGIIPLEAFLVGYMKGQARVTMLLAMISLCV